MVFNRLRALIGVFSSLTFGNINAAPVTNELVQEVVNKLPGHFSNIAQSIETPIYYPVHLRHCLIKVHGMPHKEAVYMYVEQSIEGNDPYRQRVYGVHSPQKGVVESVIYDIKLPRYSIDESEADEQRVNYEKIDMMGLCDRAYEERHIQHYKLESSCAMTLLKRADGVWEGNTPPEGCRGIAHPDKVTKSHVLLSDDTLETLDQGFDAAGNKVWGANAPYIFKKVSSYLF